MVAPRALSGITLARREPGMRRMASTTGVSARLKSDSAEASVPRAGQMISPQTACSRMALSTSACRFGLSAVCAIRERRPDVRKTDSIPTASSAKKGLARSLMTMPTTLVRALRRLAAPRL